MQTIQIRLTKNMIEGIDKLVSNGIYPNRSEAIRDCVRITLDKRKNDDMKNLSLKDLKKIIDKD